MELFSVCMSGGWMKFLCSRLEQLFPLLFISKVPSANYYRIGNKENGNTPQMSFELSGVQGWLLASSADLHWVPSSVASKGCKSLKKRASKICSKNLWETFFHSTIMFLRVTETQFRAAFKRIRVEKCQRKVQIATESRNLWKLLWKLCHFCFAHSTLPP